MKYIWKITLDDYYEILKLAKLNGKKEGDSIETELLEILKKKNIYPFGITNIDIDMFTGNLREQGYKVLNLKEIERQKNREN